MRNLEREKKIFHILLMIYDAKEKSQRVIISTMVVGYIFHKNVSHIEVKYNSIDLSKFMILLGLNVIYQDYDIIVIRIQKVFKPRKMHSIT